MSLEHGLASSQQSCSIRTPLHDHHTETILHTETDLRKQIYIKVIKPCRMENLDYKDEVKKTNLFYQIQQYQHDEELVQPSKYHVDSDNADNEWKSKQ